MIHLLEFVFVILATIYKTIHASLFLFVPLPIVDVQTAQVLSVPLVILALALFPNLLIVCVMIHITLMGQHASSVIQAMLLVRHVNQLTFVQVACKTSL